MSTVQRSIEMGSPGIVLSTGLELTEANRPRVPLSQTLFEPVLTTKAALEGPCCPVSCVAMNVSQTHWGRCSFDEGVVTVLQGSDRTLPTHTLPPPLSIRLQRFTCCHLSWCTSSGCS